MYTVNVEQDLNRRYRFVVRDERGTTVKSSGPRYLTTWGALRKGNKWVEKNKPLYLGG